MYSIYGDTDIGLKYQSNQDSMMARSMQTPDGEAVFAILCDGMGGLEQGELASATVVLGFAQWFEKIFSREYKRCSEAWLREQWQSLVTQLNLALSEYGKQKDLRVGTTLTGVLIYGEWSYVINIGDSRTYGLGMEGLKKLTRDHSFVEEKLASGELTIEEAKKHPKRHCITRCIGVQEETAVDLYCYPTQEQSVFMMCSDGFYGKCNEKELKELMRTAEEGKRKKIQNRVHHIFHSNQALGEKDNMSVLLVAPERASILPWFCSQGMNRKSRGVQECVEENWISSQNYIPVTIENEGFDKDETQTLRSFF